MHSADWVSLFEEDPPLEQVVAQVDLQALFAEVDCACFASGEWREGSGVTRLGVLAGFSDRGRFKEFSSKIARSSRKITQQAG